MIYRFHFDVRHKYQFDLNFDYQTNFYRQTVVHCCCIQPSDLNPEEWNEEKEEVEEKKTSNEWKNWYFWLSRFELTGGKKKKIWPNIKLKDIQYPVRLTLCCLLFKSFEKFICIWRLMYVFIVVPFSYSIWEYWHVYHLGDE